MDKLTQAMRDEAIEAHMLALGVSAEEATEAVDTVAALLQAEAKAPVTYTNRAARRAQARGRR